MMLTLSLVVHNTPVKQVNGRGDTLGLGDDNAEGVIGQLFSNCTTGKQERVIENKQSLLAASAGQEGLKS